jgi:hypothetical protein
MVSGFPSFAQIAPYLTNPLVLVGFVLLLIFGVHKALIKSNILPPVSPTASNKIVRLILHYGFAIALLVLLLGFLRVCSDSRAQSDLGSAAKSLETTMKHAQLEIRSVDFPPGPYQGHDLLTWYVGLVNNAAPEITQLNEVSYIYSSHGQGTDEEELFRYFENEAVLAWYSLGNRSLTQGRPMVQNNGWVLKPDEADAINHYQCLLYVIVGVRWKDETGTYETDGCYSLLDIHNPTLWRQCSVKGANSTRKLSSDDLAIGPFAPKDRPWKRLNPPRPCPAVTPQPS